MLLHRNIALSFVLGALATSGMRPATAQQIDETLQQKVALDTTATDPSEALLAMARTAKVNVIADATQWKNIDATTPINWEAYPQSGLLVSYLLEFSDARGLSWTHPDAKTFLFWKQPALSTLVARIIAGEDVRLPVAPIEAKAWQELWLAYLSGLTTAKPDKATNIAAPNGVLVPRLVSVRVKDLPLRLRRPVISLIQNHLVASSFADYDKQVFSDEFWNHAAVGLRVQGEPRLERLVLITHDKGTTHFNSIDPIHLPNPADGGARPARQR